MTLYNEIDPHAAQWLQNLSDAGHIAEGRVDTRSVVDLRGRDLEGHVQVHGFAGIGTWSYALRRAGWPDDCPVWTGSPPCQPFSQAGRRRGKDDHRHLWPDWFRLIEECRPPLLFGEQVGSKDGLDWLDAVRADLENAHYATAAFDLCAASVGAPHIRQRLFFVAIADLPGRQGIGVRLRQRRARQHLLEAGGDSETEFLADAERLGQSARGSGQASGRDAEQSDRHSQDSRLVDPQDERCPWIEGIGRQTGDRPEQRSGARWMGDAGLSRSGRDAGTLHRAEDRGTEKRLSVGSESHKSESPGAIVVLGDSVGPGLEGRESVRGDDGSQFEATQRASGAIRQLADASSERAVLGRPSFEDGDGAHVRVPRADGATRGFWADAQWIYCRDGKYRPVEPGSSALAPRSAFRVGSGGPFEGKSRQGLLKGYGNSIVAPLATVFIECVIDWLLEDEDVKDDDR